MADKIFNVTELRNNNRYRILDYLRYGSLSRAELSQKTGLAKSSVTTLTNEMIEKGLLTEAGPAKKVGGVGRTRILLEISGDYGFVLGINLHRKNISVIAIDITANPIFDFKVDTKNYNTKSAFDFIKKTLHKKIAEYKLNKNLLLGIGISAPGPLDCEKGIILEPPNFPLFNNSPIAKKFEEEFNVPVVLENDAVALALAEHYYVKKQSGSSLFVTVLDGIGAALMKNGEIFGGSHGIAGELGHISIDPLGETCPCGNRGCLEQYATFSALKSRFGINDVTDLLDQNNQKGRKAFWFLINTLGNALVGAVNLFDLDTVIFYGEYEQASEQITTALKEYISEHSVICRMHPVNVETSGQNKTSSAFAAAIPALNVFFKNGKLVD